MSTDGSWAELGHGVYYAPVDTVLPGSMRQGIGEAIQRVADVGTEALEVLAPQLKAMAKSSKPKQSPPMWANNPAHTRRTAFGPTKRVK